MPSMTEITCKCGCRRKKLVRTSDVKRGWGKFYSKACKARKQNRSNWHERNLEVAMAESEQYYIESIHPFSTEALGQY